MSSNRFRTGYVATAEDGAELTFSSSDKGSWSVHYSPSDTAITIARGIDRSFAPPAGPILLIEGDPRNGRVITHPLNTNAANRRFLEPKYETLRTMTFDGFGSTAFELSDEDAAAPEDMDALREILRDLPAGFLRDPFFGLGMQRELQYLIDAVEELAGVTDLRIRPGPRTGLPLIEGNSYVLSVRMFDEARRAINRAHAKALSIASLEKRTFAHNTLLTAVDPEAFPRKHASYRKDAIVEAIGKNLPRDVALSLADSDAVVAAVQSSARRLSRTKPAELLELAHNIEVVTLESLIERLKQMLSKKLKEADWQAFFLDNAFVLRLAFGLPITMVGDQISVGGRKFSGGGDKISDFAVKAAASGNLALIEIKTPQTALLEASPYRGDLHAPSRELSGAVNQVLDQRYQLQKSITLKKDSSRIWDVETYAVQGLVIAGRIPDGAAKLKSFELFRNGLKSVMVVTFDELLMKLEHLVEALRTPSTETAVPEAP